jgi:hypothetical protein
MNWTSERRGKNTGKNHQVVHTHRLSPATARIGSVPPPILLSKERVPIKNSAIGNRLGIFWNAAGAFYQAEWESFSAAATARASRSTRRSSFKTCVSDRPKFSFRISFPARHSAARNSSCDRRRGDFVIVKGSAMNTRELSSARRCTSTVPQSGKGAVANKLATG